MLIRHCPPRRGQRRRLWSDERAVVLIEFAAALPVLLLIGLFGVEIANLASTKLQVSQMALSVADNASRLGQTDNSAVTPTISEDDVSTVLIGAMRQGESIKFEQNGRIILSSLERDPATGRQFIHWQRCRGVLTNGSAYGNDGNRNGLTGPTLAGMGQGSGRVTAGADAAIMFVEIVYRYDSLFEPPFGTGDRTLRQEAAFMVRDDRTLRPSNQSGLTGTPANSCR